MPDHEPHPLGWTYGKLALMQTLMANIPGMAPAVMQRLARAEDYLLRRYSREGDRKEGALGQA